MRKIWLKALAATAALTLGACAAGSTTTLLDPGAGPEDAGYATQAGGGDSGGLMTQSPGDDSGATVQQPGSEDSGTGEADSGDPVSGEDSGAVSDDSGGGGEDSGGGGGEDGGGAGGPTDCPSTAGYALAWATLHALKVGTSCSSGPAACSASDCCYVPPGAASEALCVAK
jgi:hypothetical protein